MHLVKWFRKNNAKLMAVVVILLMIAFIMPSSLRRYSQYRQGSGKAAAYIRDNGKITNNDLILARHELEVLKMLRADFLLVSGQDLQATLLSEVLFTERRTSPRLIQRIKQTIRTGDYRISDKQINDIYRGSMGSSIYWLLLKTEAEQMGFRLSNEQVRNLLGRAIPQLFPDITYSQLVGSIVNQMGVSEENVLTTFGKLLAVLEYARMICSSGDVTTQQMMYNASRDEETINVEFVKFDSAVFAETGNKPSREEIVEQFERYKKFFAGAVSEENPYGFGYKFPDRVGLEYITVKLDDVSNTVTPITQEEAEEYYQKNRKRYTEQIRTEPNDPNSPLIERVKSYAEVANSISEQLLRGRIDSKAEKILQEARTIIGAGFENPDVESKGLSDEQLKKMAGDYESTAKQLAEKYKVKVYAGQTGLLSANDIEGDKYLGMMYLRGVTGTMTRLSRVVFAIDEVGVSELGPFDTPKPRLYESIGPIKDLLGQMMLIVRVTETQKACEPESINQTYSRKTISFEQPENQAGENVYSVESQVTEDLKRLAAMDTAKSKAEEFVRQVTKNGWDGAIDGFNKMYGQAEGKDQTGKGPFELQSLTNLQRQSKGTMVTLATQDAGSPTGSFLVNKEEKEGQFVNQLYSLVPQDAETIEALPLIMEFKPDMSYFCLKSISVKRLGQGEYEQIKATQAYREELIESQSLAVVHFNPDNILRRMDFRLAAEDANQVNIPAPVEYEEDDI